MLYLLYGNIEYLIDKEIEKIIKQNNIENIDINKYELDSTNFNDIIEDAMTISLFSSKKMIIVNNAYIFTSIKKAGDISLFEDYFENVNPDTIIIFKLNEEKIDERKKIVKQIKKIGVVKDFNKNDDINNVIIGLFDNYKINNEQIKLLIDRVGTDIYILNQEINKIKTYKDKDLIITNDDIINLTCENIELDIFKLMDAIIDNKKEEAITIYNEMLKYNMEPIQIIITLANKYRLIYQAKELAKKGYKEDEIAHTLNQSNPKYMYVLIKIGKKYTSEKLLEILEDLINLDYDIKSGAIDKKIAFELFILKK